ncbi:hypothetical protein [Streptomyces acidicola]|uniref:hypothetical protein n=1 Tax=Streptomyces acidicola TaxID=2596892 RepID=UPI00381E1A19
MTRTRMTGTRVSARRTAIGGAAVVLALLAVLPMNAAAAAADPAPGPVADSVPGMSSGSDQGQGSDSGQASESEQSSQSDMLGQGMSSGAEESNTSESGMGSQGMAAGPAD